MLVARYVPAADEVFRLHRGDDAECRFFRSFCDTGHYRGASPDSTRQGTYAVTPSGVLLESLNTNDPARMRAFLARSLARYDALSKAERLGAAPSEGDAPWRWETHAYPEDGLVLEVVSRDLPRPEGAARGWRGQAWNRDWAWFRKDEARAFLPAEPAPGAVQEVPRPLVERLVRLHLIDLVRGQTTPFAPSQVERAELRARVVKVRKEQVTIELEGHTRAVERGRWQVDDDPATDQERGVEAKLAGEAVFDLASGRFISFAMVAAASRWGGTRYNQRHDDLAPQGMGVAFTLSKGEAGERVAPAFIYDYGWPRR